MDDQYKAYCQRMMQMATQSPSTSMPPGPQPGPSHLTSTSVTPSRIPTSLRESNLRNYANDSPSTPNGRVRSAKDTTNGNGPSYPRVSLGSEKPPKSGVSIDVNDGKYAVSKLADVTKKDYTIETPTRRKNAGQKSTVFGDPSLLTGGCTTAKSSEPAKLDETPIVGKFDFYDPTPVLNKAEALRQQMELALRQIQQGGESDEMEAEEAESQTNQTQMQHAESPANKQKKKIEKKSGFESYFDYELSKKEPKAKESASGTRNENKPSTSYRYVPDDVFGEGLGEQKAASSLEIHVPAAIKPAESTTVAPPSLETFGSATWAKAKLFSASNEADLIAKNLELAASLSEQVTSLSERNATMAHKNDTVPQTESATDIKATPAHAPELKTPSAKGKERAKPAEDNESPTSHTLTPDNGITLCLPIPIGLAESNLQQHTDDPTCAPGGENTPPGPAAPFIGPPRPPSEPQSSQVLQSGRSTPNPEAGKVQSPRESFFKCIVA